MKKSRDEEEEERQRRLQKKALSLRTKVVVSFITEDDEGKCAR